MRETWLVKLGSIGSPRGGLIVKKFLHIVMLAMIGLTLMGSTVTCTSIEEEGELLGVAEQYTAPTWSKDGSHIVFAHPPAGVFVVEASSTRMWSLPPGSPMGTHRSLGNFSPALSPDGSRVAYAAIERSGVSSDIVTSALDGSDLRRLTNHKAIDAYPVWSPDGSQILFYSSRAGSPGNPTLSLFIVDSDGSNLRELSPESSRPIAKYPPVWSPDGQRIAFVVWGDGYEFLVQTIRADGADLTELGKTVSNPVWSPDGTRLAFIREGDETRGLYTMDPDGGNERLLSSFDIPPTSYYHNPSWSPDGSEILYGVGFRSFVVGVDGSEPRVIGESATPWGRGRAAWSPDGSRIAFHVLSDLSSDFSDIVLHTMARDGSDPRILVRGTLERLVAEHSDWRDVTVDIAACYEGDVVKNPERNPGLVQDCETLQRLRKALAGEAVLNWSPYENILYWKGLSFEGSPPRVTGLILPNLGPTNLTGVVPPELGDLTELEVLALQSNRLTGGIPPELGNLTNLRRLELGSNALEGPIPWELGTLASLEKLNLMHNALTGSIPPEVGNLSNLSELWLTSNLLTGSIPPEIGNLSRLKELRLGSNRLTGSIPPELGNLSNLSELWLTSNLLTGSIPTEIGNLSNLKELRLQSNRLTGEYTPRDGQP